MNGKQLSAIIIILLVSDASGAMQGSGNKKENETVWERAVTNQPYSMLTGGYLLAKDFIQRQLVARAPHVLVLAEDHKMPALCPRIDFYRHNRIMGAFGRYRNVGAFIVATVLFSNMSLASKAHDEQVEKILADLDRAIYKPPIFW